MFLREEIRARICKFGLLATIMGGSLETWRARVISGISYLDIGESLEELVFFASNA
jgi:hypothetical protein